MRTILLALTLVFVAEDVDAQRRRRCSGEMPRIGVDSAATVFLDCDVDRVARIDGARPQLDVDLSDSPGVKEGCYVVEVDVVVDAKGAVEPTTMTVRRSELRPLEKAVLERLPSVRFQPAQKEGKAVRQLVRYRTTYTVTSREVVGDGSAGVTVVNSRGKDCR